MQHYNKLVILIVFMAVAIFVWIPKGRKPIAASANTLEQVIPTAAIVARKKTEFVDWGRNPFIWSQAREEGDTFNPVVFAIIWNGEKAEAMINESIVRVGDKVTGKTVKRIEKNRVILTDGTKDYVLELQE